MSRFLMIFCGLLTIGCGQPVTQSPGSEKIDSLQTGIVKAHRECNSIYFWKTTFDPTKTELDFLQKYDVQRLYIRFFDVALDNSWLEEKLTVVPIATTVFAQTPPAGLEIVPTVYITLEALRSVKGKEAEYADKITTRILAMATRHKISNISEVQFDCDWTGTTQESYFELCRIAKDTLYRRGVGLSATIRLHQLRKDPPPVDRGVLMLYNTGALKSADTENSILNYSDIEFYLKNAVYPLHLDFAYPTFSWGVWFRDNKFRAILRTINFSDKTYYQSLKKGTYKVVKDHYLESHELLRGDIIRLENSRYVEILKTQCRVEKELGGDNYSVILYHLDSANLSKYTPDEIMYIYNR
ncbi:hypothetical protein [Alistipes sp. i18-0019-D1]|uniref:hypothetical protein n=1 Tax=Alistipes sp. i18-0019-D1 TaxID=3132707 RepID=UPI0036F3ECD8